MQSCNYKSGFSHLQITLMYLYMWKSSKGRTRGLLPMTQCRVQGGRAVLTCKCLGPDSWQTRMKSGDEGRLLGTNLGWFVFYHINRSVPRYPWNKQMSSYPLFLPSPCKNCLCEHRKGGRERNLQQVMTADRSRLKGNGEETKVLGLGGQTTWLGGEVGCSIREISHGASVACEFFNKSLSPLTANSDDWDCRCKQSTFQPGIQCASPAHSGCCLSCRYLWPTW